MRLRGCSIFPLQDAANPQPFDGFQGAVTPEVFKT
jgi:hypothetical protein